MNYLLARNTKIAKSKPSMIKRKNDEAELTEKEPEADRWSKSKKKRMRRRKAQTSRDYDGIKDQFDLVSTEKFSKKDIKSDEEATQMNPPRTSTLQQSFKDRLTGSRFRILNEELYTTSSNNSFKLFSTNPVLYNQYHEGFRFQVSRWPMNPIESVVKIIREHQADNWKCLKKVVVADFGCGDAELAKHLSTAKNKNERFSFEVFSFDLVACCDLVIACDMAHVPLEANTVDVGIFCLSLMGTNMADFIREAHRVLNIYGILIIADVQSRFENEDEQDGLQAFIQVLSQLGFEVTYEDKPNKMFFLLKLIKLDMKPNKTLLYEAKPCIYKRR